MNTGLEISSTSDIVLEIVIVAHNININAIQIIQGHCQNSNNYNLLLANWFVILLSEKTIYSHNVYSDDKVNKLMTGQDCI